MNSSKLLLDSLNEFDQLYDRIIESPDDLDSEQNQDDDIIYYELVTRPAEEGNYWGDETDAEDDDEEEEENNEIDTEDDKVNTYSDSMLWKVAPDQEMLYFHYNDSYYYFEEDDYKFSPLANSWVPKYVYDINCEEAAEDFLNFLLEMRDAVRYGQLHSFREKISTFETLTESEFLSDILYRKIGLDCDDISRMLWSIVDKVKLEDFFENEILVQPTSIADLTEELIFQISRDENILYEITPYHFEQLISKIFQKFKMQTELTKRTRDGGRDIIAFEDTCFSKNKYIIECKRYAKDKKVGIDIVQRLYGVKMSEKASKAFLVTSSSFTKSAIKWARQHCWELELKDHNDIRNWLNAYWR